jgi:hypothetical protein
MTNTSQTPDPRADLATIRAGTEEAVRVMAQARQRIEDLGRERDELLGYVNGLLGLVQLIGHRNDLPRDVRLAMFSNHRYVDALAYVSKT